MAVVRESKAHPAFCTIPSLGAPNVIICGSFKVINTASNVTVGTKARMYCGMILVCNNAEGGMRFTFPPYR
jgi:hypothetical protein